MFYFQSFTKLDAIFCIKYYPRSMVSNIRITNIFINTKELKSSEFKENT